MNQTRRRPNNNSSRKPHSSNGSNTFDSQGPDGKIRGTAHQIFEKYIALARDANSSGDRIAAESFYQFADHYFRLMTPSNETESKAWRDHDDSPHQSKSHAFQQNSFAAEMENSPQPPSSPAPATSERHENSAPKNTRSSGERSNGRENRFENRRSRHPYLGGNSRPYGDRQNRSEQPASSGGQESLPLEPQPAAASSKPEQDIITVIQ